MQNIKPLQNIIHRNFREPPCIKRFLLGFLKKKSAGSGGGIYILGLVVLLVILMFCSVVFVFYGTVVVKDNIDDALMSSLLAASTINTVEYGKSHQIVIFEDMTTPADPLNDPNNITGAVGDSYLNNAYDVFEESFITNLGLNADLTTDMPLVQGSISIDEFTVYNMYRVFDAYGNTTDTRFYEYRYVGGNWLVSAKNINEAVSVYNSMDGTTTPLENTTITAKLSFDLQFFPDLSFLMDDPNFGDLIHKVVSYQRMVDITFH